MKWINRTSWGIMLLGLITLVPQWAMGQDQPDSLHKYFDESGYRPPNNLISTNFLSPTAGLLGVRYERLIVDHFSLEVGVSKVMPYYLFEFLTLINDFVPYFDPQSGVELSISPHFYFRDDGFDMSYLGPRFAYRKHLMKDGTTMQFQDITANYGLNGTIDHLVLGFSAGAGLRRIHGNHGSRGAGSIFTTYTPLMLGSLSIGFQF